MRFTWEQKYLILITTGILVFAPLAYMLATPFITNGIEESSFGTVFSSRQLSLAVSSFLLAFGATCGASILGFPFALLVSRTDLYGRNFFFILGMVPLLIPPNIQAIAWNHLMLQILKSQFIDLHNIGGAVFVLSLTYFPIISFFLVSGLRSIDRNLEEAAILTKGMLHAFNRITLPLLRPHAFSGLTLVFILAVVDFGVADMLRVKVYPIEIFIQFSAFYDEMGAMILTAPLICITGILISFQKWNLGNRQYFTYSSSSAPPLIVPLGKMSFIAFFFCFIVVLMAFVLPCISLVYMAGSFENYVEVFTSSYTHIIYSTGLAFSGGALCLLLAFLLSYLFTFSRSKFLNIIEFIIYTPLAIPSVALGIGLIHIWNRPGLDFVYGSSLILIIGYIAHFLPIALMSTSSGIKQLDPYLLEAAELHSKKTFSVIFKIVIPLLSPSLLTGFFLVFVLSLGDLGTTLLLIPPGRETLPIKIYNLMHYGADNMVAALSLMLITVILIVGILFLLSYTFLQRRIAR